MDDRFLRDLKRQPNPDFAARLRATLHTLPANVVRIAPVADLKRWFAVAASIAVVGFVFTLPAVQAGAQAFLDLFRVAQFTGVRFDAERLRNLESSGLNLQTMFGDVEALTTPQEPVSYATAAEAGAAAGVRVRTPAWVPPGYSSTGFVVSSEHAARITASTAGLQALLDALALDDVELPEGLDGQDATVRLPPIVNQTYANGDRMLHVIQSRSPDVSFPAGLDLSKLAYAGLRILGTPQDEAYRMSVTIDWRTTMIVPVPTQAAAYRPINVAGNEGLLIEGFAAGEQRGHSLLMWSAGGQTFAVTGPINGVELLEVAQTLQ
ncbi:MAG TPA: hypothetical protein VIM81_10705 [Gammaproteobacteria bacterium]